MPELPEVETVRNDLLRYVKYKTIKQVKIKQDFYKKIQPAASRFIKLVKNQVINNIKRRGKLLIWELAPDKNILAHLKMTGQFVYWEPLGLTVQSGHPIEQPCQRPDRFNKVLFEFTDHSCLYYNDPRKFGYLKFVDDEQVKNEIAKYGIEPLSPEFTLAGFKKILAAKKRLPIKQVLLRQDLIAGIGNIYADESCFAAGIRGARKIETLSDLEIKKLYQALKKILKKAVKYRGTSVNTYVDCLGQKGSYVKYLKVYHRAGQPCLKCGQALIKKIKIAGRGTSYCPICQR